MASRRVLVLPAAFAMTAAAVLLCRPETAGAGVVPLSRETSISVRGQAGDQEYDESGGISTFETFNDFLERSITSGVASARSRAGQNSALQIVEGELLNAVAGGQTEAQVGEFNPIAAFAQSTFLLRFQVTDEPTTFRAVGSGNGTLGGGVQMRLFRDGAGDEPVFDLAGGQGRPPVELDQFGTLTPGTWTLDFRALTSGTPQGDFGSGSVAIGFGVAIPLPPAAWAGMGGMALAVVAARAMRRGTTA